MEKINRIIWIDWLKTILINTVIIGHTFSCLTPIIYLFHMPLFFFVSGLLTNIKKQREKGLWHSIEPLIYGIFAWNLIFIIANATLILCFNSSINPRIEVSSISMNTILIRPLLGVIFCNYSNNALPLIPQFWFVWTLILCKVCYYYISFLDKRYIYSIIIASILFTIVNSSIYFLTNNYYLNRLLAALPYYIIGSIIRGNYNFMNSKANITVIIISLFLCAGIIISMCICNNYIINFADYIFEPNYGIVFFVSIIFSFLLINICKLLYKSSIVTVISTGTFFILAIHRLLILILEPFLIFDNSRILLSILITFICYKLLIHVSKIAPILLGKKQ